LPWVRKKRSRYTIMHFAGIAAAQNSHRTLGVQGRRAVPSPGNSGKGALEGQGDSSDAENLPSQAVG